QSTGQPGGPMAEIGTAFSLVPTLPASNSCRTLNNAPKHQFGYLFRKAQLMASRIDGNGRKILVIDDDLAIRVLLQAVLKRMKFDVELAEDGSVGLEKLRQNGKFDLILLDLMMPKINGYEFIERVTKDFPQYQKHIIVFTAAGKRGVDKIPANAVCNSILKPFDLEKFVEMISDCLDGVHAPH